MHSGYWQVRNSNWAREEGWKLISTRLTNSESSLKFFNSIVPLWPAFPIFLLRTFLLSYPLSTYCHFSAPRSKPNSSLNWVNFRTKQTSSRSFLWVARYCFHDGSMRRRQIFSQRLAKFFRSSSFASLLPQTLVRHVFSNCKLPVWIIGRKLCSRIF